MMVGQHGDTDGSEDNEGKKKTLHSLFVKIREDSFIFLLKKKWPRYLKNHKKKFKN